MTHTFEFWTLWPSDTPGPPDPGPCSSHFLSHYSLTLAPCFYNPKCLYYTTLCVSFHEFVHAATEIPRPCHSLHTPTAWLSHVYPLRPSAHVSSLAACLKVLPSKSSSLPHLFPSVQQARSSFELPHVYLYYCSYASSQDSSVVCLILPLQREHLKVSGCALFNPLVITPSTGWVTAGTQVFLPYMKCAYLFSLSLLAVSLQRGKW